MGHWIFFRACITKKDTDPQSCDAQVERQLLLLLTAQRKTGICPRAKEVLTPLTLLVCHAYKALCVLALHCMHIRLDLNADTHR